MRITARQLRQIIKEELNRNMNEEDETAHVKMPMGAGAQPKKRGLFGPRETPADEVEWDSAWATLSQGEKDSLVAAIKKDPSFPTIVGTAVRNEDFDIKAFTDFLNTPYPVGGSEAFETLVGGPTVRGMPIGTLVKQLADRFSGNDTRVHRLQGLAIRVMSGEGTKLDRVVYENAQLVAALERIYVGEGLYHDDYRGGLEPPKDGSQLSKFVYAALGI